MGADQTRALAALQVSATLLGEPDLGLLTPPEMARKTGQVCSSVPDLPIIADADTGEWEEAVGSRAATQRGGASQEPGAAPAGQASSLPLER